MVKPQRPDDRGGHEPTLTEARVRQIVSEMFISLGLRNQLADIDCKLDCLKEFMMGFAQEQAVVLKSLNVKVDALVASELKQDQLLISIAADVTKLKETILNADSPEDVAAAKAEVTALETKVDAAVTASEAQTAAAQAIDDMVPAAPPNVPPNA